jgi:hypothetical protein
MIYESHVGWDLCQPGSGTIPVFGGLRQQAVLIKSS